MADQPEGQKRPPKAKPPVTGRAKVEHTPGVTGDRCPGCAAARHDPETPDQAPCGLHGGVATTGFCTCTTDQPTPRAPEPCAHSWRFMGDDPYTECIDCGEIRDAITGHVVRSAVPIYVPREPSTPEYACANCGGPITVKDNAGGGLISVNVDGHARPAHRTCPQPSPDDLREQIEVSIRASIREYLRLQDGDWWDSGQSVAARDSVMDVLRRNGRL